METSSEITPLEQFSSKKEKLLKEGYEVKIQDYLIGGWELFKKYPLGLVGFTFLYLLAVATLGQIPIIGWIGTTLAAYYFMVGQILVFKKIDSKGVEQVKFSDFFEAFQLPWKVLQGYLLETLISFVVGLVTFLPIVIFVGLMFYFSGRTFNTIPHDLNSLLQSGALPIIFLGAFLFAIVMALNFLVFILLRFNLFLLVDKRLDPLEAIKSSLSITKKGLVPFCLFYILLGILFLLGIVLTLGLGLFFMPPLFSAMSYWAYKDVIGVTLNPQT